MPKLTYSTPEPPLFERITGDFPFEVVGVSYGLSNGPKTNGSETMELKLKFFKDNTFTEPVGQWTYTFIFHEKTNWKINQFAICANIQVDGRTIKPGDEFDYANEHVLIGLRGWALCEPEKDERDKSKEYNRVKEFYTDKPKIAKRIDDF